MRRGLVDFANGATVDDGSKNGETGKMEMEMDLDCARD